MRKKYEKKINKTLILSMAMMAVCAVVAWLGILFMGERQYYFTSLVIIVCAMMPFFISFENRKPQAREIVIIAVLVAIGVAGRAAFFMVPNFKPVMAIVIITGVCFGAQSGFLTGTMTAFVSNFFFGQGVHTPWQMFGFGIVGFLAGLLFSNSRFKDNRLVLCAFGGVATFVLYGAIVDISTVVAYTAEFSFGAYLSVLASGALFNAIHAAATVIFLYLFARPMMEKLDRVKIKHGLITQDLFED